MSSVEQQVAEILKRYRYSFANEIELQDGVARALEEAGIAFEREFRLSALDRPDFMIERLAIEVKIKGGLADVLAQLQRYAKHHLVDEVLLVTSRVMLARVPETLAGKPISVVLVRGVGTV